MAFPLQHSRGRRSGLCCGGDCTAAAIWRPCPRLWRYIRGSLARNGRPQGFPGLAGKAARFVFCDKQDMFPIHFDGRGAYRQILSIQMYILDIAKACINSRQEHDKKTSAFALKTGQRSRSFNIWDKFIYKFFYGR